MTHWYERLAILVVVSLCLALGSGVAAAQENPQRPPQATLVGGIALIRTMAELSGQPMREILTQIEGEMTLNDLAVALELDPATVIDQTAIHLTERVNQAVTNGRITQERADEILATLEADLTALMAQPLPAHLHRPGEQNPIGTLAELTGLEPLALLQELRGGATIQSLLEANGSSVDAAVSALMGRLEARSDRILDRIEARLRDLLSGDWEPSTRRFGEWRDLLDGLLPDVR